MPERRARKPHYSIDVVLLTPVRGQLAVLLCRSPDGRDKWTLPWESPRPAETLDGAAARITKNVLGDDAVWREQIGAFGDGRRHPSDAEISVGFAGLVPMAPRQRQVLDSAVSMIRSRMDQSPVAFRLLPQMFTLTELQQMYELLLAKRLHKASFRRALQGAWLVEPTDEWRSEGRGRPAQLYRYAPRKRRPAQRGIRLDLLS